ncbi:MAG: restriction endonuclease [Planctomycetota bacterium]
MASIHQVRGLLLEEAVLTLLRAAGYRTMTDPGTDPTLAIGPAGITVAGRGTKHQIDAIADLRIGQPFSNPQRLLVEAKCYADHRRIGLPVVRGAVGVLKDVSEYWVARSPGQPSVRRFHYQTAIFSSSEFTAEAQDYAFAQDVYLLPLARSTYFAPVIGAIDAATQGLPTRDEQVTGVVLADVRKKLRHMLQPDTNGAVAPTQGYPWLTDFVEATHAIGKALIAILGHAFPVFLTPHHSVNLDQLFKSRSTAVTIHFGDQSSGSGWTICDPHGAPMFSFDVPKELFDHYADAGVLSLRAAANLKEAYLGEFTAVYAPADEIRILNFKIEPGWIERLRRNVPPSAGS